MNKKQFESLVDGVLEDSEIIFETLQRSLHKSSFSLNGKTICVTIQRKVYTDGTSKVSPTRKDVKEEKHDKRRNKIWEILTKLKLW